MLVVASLMPHVVLLGCALLFVGFSYGTWDVSMNAAAHGVEVAVGLPLMPRFHGAFSIGGLCGAGFGALAAALDVPVWAHLAISGCCVVATALLCVHHLPMDTHEADDEVTEAPRR